MDSKGDTMTRREQNEAVERRAMMLARTLMGQGEGQYEAVRQAASQYADKADDIRTLTLRLHNALDQEGA